MQHILCSPIYKCSRFDCPVVNLALIDTHYAASSYSIILQITELYTTPRIYTKHKTLWAMLDTSVMLKFPEPANIWNCKLPNTSAEHCHYTNLLDMTCINHKIPDLPPLFNHQQSIFLPWYIALCHLQHAFFSQTNVAPRPKNTIWCFS